MSATAGMDWETEQAWVKATRHLIRHRTGSMAAYDMTCGCEECEWARLVLTLTKRLAVAGVTGKETG